MCRLLIFAWSILASATSGQADLSIGVDDVVAKWKQRQSFSQSVSCQVDAIIHYSKESQFVSGKQFLLPTHGRSAAHRATLQLDGPAKFRFHHVGQLWHRRLGQILNVDWVRFSDGNQYVNLERGYESIPNWLPKRKVIVRPTSDSQQRGWDDELLTPLIHHYRAFNSRLCPFERSDQWSIKEVKEIDGKSCVLLAGDDKKVPFAINRYQYWVAPELDMAVVRLERFTNGWVESQFDIQYADGELGPQPTSYQMKRFSDGRILEFAKVTVKQLSINQPIDDSVFQLHSNTETP